MTDQPSLSRLLPGKAPPELLAKLLSQLPAGARNVVVGPTLGEDAAVVAIGDRLLVLAMDPVTLSAQPGRFAVAINANDIAVMGGTPRWLLASIILPAGAEESTLRSIFEEMQAGCARAGATLIGGHTEISTSVTHPVVTACMVGDVAPEDLVRSDARPGDVLLLAGPIAIEGTAILAREHAERLLSRGVPRAVIDDAAALLDAPGISVLPAVRALSRAVRPHAMHDPTEGGIVTAAREMALASGAGLRLDADGVSIIPACRTICEALRLDPLALLASGSLLAAIAPDAAAGALAALRGAGIPSSLIGAFVPPADGLILIQGGHERPLALPERDELARWNAER